MAKFLIVVKSNDQLNVNTALNVAQGLKMMGAQDVKLLFLGPGITALSKTNSVSEIVKKASENLKKSGIIVYACEMAMKNNNVKKEDLVYFDETVPRGADVILKFADQGYQVLTF